MTKLSKKKDIEEGAKEGNKQAIARGSVHTSDTNTIESVSDSASNRATVRVNVDRNLLSSLHDEIDDSDDERRKSQLCCGSCCDFVWACIVVDCIYICVLGYLNLKNLFFNDLYSAPGGKMIQMNDSEEVQLGGQDDDFYFEDEAMECYFCTTAIQSVVGMFFGLIGIIGACRFQKYMVLITGIWFIVDAIAFCILKTYFAALWVLVYSYPHIGLFLALKREKITPDNYAVTEKYCCGCDRRAN